MTPPNITSKPKHHETGTDIICPICGYKPSSEFVGGIRWKLMCQHIILLHIPSSEIKHFELLNSIKNETKLV